MSRVVPRQLEPCIRGSIFMFLSLCWHSAVCNTVSAAEDKLTPTVELREEFNDNIFLTQGNQRSDFITTIVPSLVFTHMTERRNISLLAALNRHSYNRTEHINTTDNQYNGQFEQKIAEMSNAGMSADYLRNTRADSIDTTTGLPSSAASTHFQYTVNASRSLSEFASATLAYSFAKDEYDNQASQGNQSHTVNVQLSEDLDRMVPRLKGSLSAQYNKALYRDSDIDNYTLKGGVKRAVTEKLSTNLSFGGRFTHSTFSVIHIPSLTLSTDNSDGWGIIGAASLNFTGEKNFAALSFSRDFSAASGQVGAVERTSFDLALGRAITDRITSQFVASYSINQASSGQFSSGKSDDRPFNIKADLTYRISNNFDFGVQYAYYAVTYGYSDIRVVQNSVMMRAIVKYPYIL